MIQKKTKSKEREGWDTWKRGFVIDSVPTLSAPM